MSAPARPTIGARVVRGLRHIVSLAQVELEAGNGGSFAADNGFAGERDDVQAAVSYLYRLCTWFENRAKEA